VRDREVLATRDRVLAARDGPRGGARLVGRGLSSY
jgi:hypothetical protein